MAQDDARCHTTPHGFVTQRIPCEHNSTNLNIYRTVEGGFDFAYRLVLHLNRSIAVNMLRFKFKFICQHKIWPIRKREEKKQTTLQRYQRYNHCLYRRMCVCMIDHWHISKTLFKLRQIFLTWCLWPSLSRLHWH